jgi:hypothetical protein
MFYISRYPIMIWRLSSLVYYLCRPLDINPRLLHRLYIPPQFISNK